MPIESKDIKKKVFLKNAMSSLGEFIILADNGLEKDRAIDAYEIILKLELIRK